MESSAFACGKTVSDRYNKQLNYELHLQPMLFFVVSDCANSTHGGHINRNGRTCGADDIF